MRPSELNLKVFFPKYWKAQKAAQDHDRFSVTDLAELQNRKFVALLEHAKKHSPFFIDYPSIDSVKCVQQLPLMTKKLISMNVDRIKANNYHTRDLKKNATSGSSGDSFYFFSDVRFDPTRQAIAMRGNFWAGYEFGEPLLLLWGSLSDVDKSRRLKTKLAHSSLLFNQKILSSFDMKEQDMVDHVVEINRFKPTLLVGYPSSLEVFSDYIIRERVEVHRPKGIITSGETLINSQRDITEKAFGCKVMNRYGSREMGNIASECQHQKGLHIHEDHVVVEILNEHQESCKPGELGELVITDLHSFGFPMIRYRIGDIGVFSEKPCSCGRPYRLLDRVEGRTFDIVVGCNGNRVPGTYFTLLLKKVPGIDKFQLRQNKELEIQVCVVVNADFTPLVEQQMVEGMKEKLGYDTRIVVKTVERFEPSASGKHRWIVSEASPFLDND
jgi:phenylacetate-CoA ligase